MGRLKSPQDHLVCEDLQCNCAGTPPSSASTKPPPRTTQCEVHPWNAHESMYDYHRSVQGQFWHAWTGTLACPKLLALSLGE